MIKIHAVSDASIPPAMGSCRVQRVDSVNAVCMVHNPDCTWATPYGNYCEHPLVNQITDYAPGEGGASSIFFLH